MLDKQKNFNDLASKYKKSLKFELLIYFTGYSSQQNRPAAALNGALTTSTVVVHTSQNVGKDQQQSS